MSSSKKAGVSRRELMKTTGTIAAASALAGVAIPHVHAAGSDTIQLALVGCGGRGNGAAANALNTNDSAPVKLVAMADVFQSRLDSGYSTLSDRYKELTDVPKARRFLGFDGYKDAMDALKPGDVVILTTPPAFRWVHFAYAIKKKLNVFMEKPVTVDGPSSRRMLELNKQAEALKLKVAVGLMCRHCSARAELLDRIKQGEIGEINLLRAYRQAGPTGSAFVRKNPGELSELLYQIRNFHGFLWASGGAVSDFLIHNIDESCWMKGAWPVLAKASGGRHYRGEYVDQNFDTYSIEYTFEDGTKMFVEGRTMPGCDQEFASYAHGTKGVATISAKSHSPARCATYRGQAFKKENQIWTVRQPEPNPYDLEWVHLMDAIRNGTPYNEVKRGVQASVVTAMGRVAAHTGRMITYDEMLNHEHELGPNIDSLTKDSPSPLMPDKDGKYPVPQPGVKIKREY